MRLLEVVERVDNFTYGDVPEELYLFRTHDGTASLGYILPIVADELAGFKDYVTVNNEKKIVMINPELDSFDKRKTSFLDLAKKLKAIDIFDTLNNGWRDEFYTVYHPKRTPYLDLERAFCPLLGVIMYGVHINGFIPPPVSKIGGWLFWVPKRASNRATFPGMFDNTIAGGMGNGVGAYECAVKESYEEAGITKEFLKDRLKPAGFISYIFSHAVDFKSEKGLIQPECGYVYDLEFDNETIPYPVDHEAEDFKLMSLEEVLHNIYQFKVKPNCSLVIIDFLIRKGIVNAENEPDYAEIVTRLHRRLPFELK